MTHVCTIFIQHACSVQYTGGGGEDSLKLSSFPSQKIANELLIPEPRVSGCTNNISITWLRPAWLQYACILS